MTEKKSVFKTRDAAALKLLLYRVACPVFNDKAIFVTQDSVRSIMCVLEVFGQKGFLTGTAVVG